MLMPNPYLENFGPGIFSIETTSEKLTLWFSTRAWVRKNIIFPSTDWIDPCPVRTKTEKKKRNNNNCIFGVFIAEKKLGQENTKNGTS